MTAGIGAKITTVNAGRKMVRFTCPCGACGTMLPAAHASSDAIARAELAAHALTHNKGKGWQ